MSSGGLLPPALAMGLGRAGAALGLANSTSGYTGVGGRGTALGEAGLTLGAVNAGLGAYAGFRQGGWEGNTKGVVGSVSAINLADQAAGGAGLGVVGTAAGVVGAGLSVYDFAKNWQSGKTGSEAIQGAETGASVGTLFGPEGTLVGAVIGGAVGALSSAFGPGAKDPESLGFNDYAAAFDKSGQAGVAGASPSTNMQMLAGIFDSRGGGAYSIPFYAKYGRMGENKFLVDMTSQINSAVTSGKIEKNASPQQMFQKIVLPWINTMGGNLKNAGLTAKGSPTAGPIENLLTSMIGQYQQGLGGQFTGISGEASPVTRAYGGGPMPQPSAATTSLPKIPSIPQLGIQPGAVSTSPYMRARNR